MFGIVKTLSFDFRLSWSFHKKNFSLCCSLTSARLGIKQWLLKNINSTFFSVNNEGQAGHLPNNVVPLEASYLSLVMRKPAFCICENKDADQLRGNREADQSLCFHYKDSTIPLLTKSEISSL